MVPGRFASRSGRCYGYFGPSVHAPYVAVTTTVGGPGRRNHVVTGVRPTLEEVHGRRRLTPPERRNQLRRRRLRALGVLVAMLAVVALVVVHPVRGTARVANRVHVNGPATAAVPHSPFANVALQQFLLGLQNNTGAAIYDVNTGHLYVYRANVAEVTASIMKVDILATLLWERDNQPLDGDDLGEAQLMIRDSDNDAAQDLWNEDGGSGEVHEFDADAGMGDTTPYPGGYWGLSTTTPRDQITLLQHVLLPNQLLAKTSREYMYGLMRNVVSAQDWGVSAGVPADATVALKNGWLPRPNGLWQVNSIGSVSGEGRHYLIAVMTNGNATEAYGINAIERIAAAAWTSLDTGGSNAG